MRKCDLTGKSAQYGHNVPYSKKKSKRAWQPNLQTKTLYIGGQKVRTKLAVSTIRTLKKIQKESAKTS